jgi:hypothetical protein
MLHQGSHAICTSGQDGTRLSKTKWARDLVLINVLTPWVTSGLQAIELLASLT